MLPMLHFPLPETRIFLPILLFCSSKVTLCPALADIIAAISPLAPAPIIIIALLVASVMKEIATDIAGFVSFKANYYVCIGRHVIVNGFEGNIMKIGVKFIVIKNKERTYIIQTSRWKFAKWEFSEGINEQEVL